MPSRSRAMPSSAAPAPREPLYEATFALDRLTPWARNYNQHPPEQVSRLQASLSRWGQVKPIVVWERPSGETLIVAGAGLVLAARARGAPAALKATVFPASWPEDEVVAYLVADNTLAQLSDPDEAQLAALLQAQADAGYDLASLGSSATDLEALLAQLDEMTAVDVDDDDADEDDDAGEADSDRLGRARSAVVQALIPVASLVVIERALHATGEQNRGRALATVCAAYLRDAPPDADADVDADDEDEQA